MRTSFLSFQINSKYKIPNKNNKEAIAFKGSQKPQNDDDNIVAFSVVPIFKAPIIYIHNGLINDGYDPQAIKDWDIFSVVEPEDASLKKAFQKDYAKERRKLQGKDSPFIRRKPAEDIQSMLRVYTVMKECFENQDTEEYKKSYLDLAQVLADKFGEKIPEKKPVQDLVLETLAYTNRFNEPVTMALLGVENFNNINIPQAIAPIHTISHAQAAISVIKMAKEAGLSKEMSLPLSIMINHADKKNLPVIQKMLKEQDFLIQNKNFTTEKLPILLDEFGFLAISYAEDDSITLVDIDSIMNAEEN